LDTSLRRSSSRGGLGNSKEFPGRGNTLGHGRSQHYADSDDEYFGTKRSDHDKKKVLWDRDDGDRRGRLRDSGRERDRDFSDRVRSSRDAETYEDREGRVRSSRDGERDFSRERSRDGRSVLL
jgi:hypothetical protein